MITMIKGDLLKSDCDVIGHGCNCFNSFGAGIAYQIMKEYNSAFMVDQMTLRGDKKKLGTFTKSKDNGKTIYNLYTQYGFSRTETSVDYEAVLNSLEALKRDLKKEGIYESCKLGLPLIGCGLAGGDWNVVKGMMESVFIDKEIFVYYLKDSDVGKKFVPGDRSAERCILDQIAKQIRES